MDYKHHNRPPHTPEFDLWTPEGLKAAYEWLTAEEARFDNDVDVDWKPLTDAELEALLKEIKGLKPSPLPPDIEHLGKPELADESD